MMVASLDEREVSVEQVPAVDLAIGDAGPRSCGRPARRRNRPGDPGPAPVVAPIVR
jgi:hypothetical protein